MKTTILAIALAMCALSTSAHITFMPNNGLIASGYHYTQLKIPHGYAGQYTVKFEVTIPEGIQSFKPQARAGWKIDIIKGALDEPYMSHGSQVTTGVKKVIYTALVPEAALSNDHLQVWGFQFKTGCHFADPTQVTMWNNKPTLWFPTVQYHAPAGSLEIDETTTAHWTGIPSVGINNATNSWPAALPKPAPYVIMDNWWSSCPESISMDTKDNIVEIPQEEKDKAGEKEYEEDRDEDVVDAVDVLVLATDVESHKNKFVTHETKINTLSTDVDKCKESINSFQAEIETLKSEIAKLKNDMTANSNGGADYVALRPSTLLLSAIVGVLGFALAHI